MRKLLFAVMVAAIVFGACCVWADEGSKMTFDNVTFGKAYKIKGYASITLLGFKFVNTYAQWEDGKASAEKTQWGQENSVYYKKPANNKINFAYTNCNFWTSGNETDFAWLKVDIINLQKIEANYTKDIVVKVIYDDEYEYNGWVRQFNYDYSNSEVYSKNQEAGVIGWPVCLSPIDEMSIKPMYKGHYAFGCTLPNAVVEDKDSPLRMEITVGDHKLTYNIR